MPFQSKKIDFFKTKLNLPGIKLPYIGYLPMLPVQAYWYLYLIFFYLHTLLKLSYQRPEKISKNLFFYFFLLKST